MRALKLILCFAVAVSVAAYVTGLLRVVLGFVLGASHPYMGLWNDIAQFPLLFMLVFWPGTAIVLLAALGVAHFFPTRGRRSRWAWRATCAFSFAMLGTLIVAANSSVPWGNALSLFSAYSQSWSDTSGPLFKLALGLSFVGGGVAGALVFDGLAKPRLKND